MELLNFIFADVAHFFGTIILLCILFAGIEDIINAFKNKHDEQNKSFIEKGSIMIRISEQENWCVDYDPERGMYRVTYFENNHYVDECCFDAYEDKEVKERKKI